jgi:hypothetical protein
MVVSVESHAAQLDAGIGYGSKPDRKFHVWSSRYQRRFIVGQSAHRLSSCLTASQPCSNIVAMSSPKRIPKTIKKKPQVRNSPVESHETISVPRADIYRLAAAARIDHRTVIAFLSGRKVYEMTADAIRRGAASIGIRLPERLNHEA